MVAEQDVAVGRDIVEAVGSAERGGWAARVELHDVAGDVACVEAVRDQLDRDRCGDDPQRVDVLAPLERDDCQRAGCEQGEGAPADLLA
jgi:hypothetical protein